jgi:hypothetical protein
MGHTLTLAAMGAVAFMVFDGAVAPAACASVVKMVAIR